ncbi:MAG: tyrosine-type recombinase/integrase [Oscillospiraceae bacterium]|jgi:integrase|nr:tyrosine-type recombinase/integrase [Oscillospiraceae bacterium]
MASIRKRGNSYLLRVCSGYTVDGKQVDTTKTWRIPDGMTEKQAEKEAQRQAVLFEEECRGGATTSTVKFDTYFTQWFDEYATIKLKAKTIQGYRWPEKRIRTEFGHMRLDKITLRDIQRLVGTLHKEGLAAKSIKNYVSLISAVYRYAIKHQLVSKNPCTGVDLPRNDSKEREILTIPEVQQLLTLLEEEPAENMQFVVFLTLAVYTGFRRGELLGLEWKDFALNSGLVSVKRAAYRNMEHGHFTDTPKSKKSYRTIKLPDEVTALLTRYRDRQRTSAATLGSKWTDTDRIFTSWDGSYINPNAPERFYHKFCARHGLRVVTLHSFRHLNASVLINAGLDVKTVQAALGHSDATTTLNTYAHEFQTAQARVCDAVSNALKLNLGA